MRDCFGMTLQQYIYFGGYPGAASYIHDEKRWRNYVKDSLIEPSITKDILLDTQIAKPYLLRQLFEIGSGYSGELLSLTKVAGRLQEAGNITTLAGYLHLLDECGLLCGLQKFAMDNARRYKSIPKFQVYNNALRNAYAEESFSEAIENPKAWGRYAESAIGAFLVGQSRILDYNVYYWREGADEVDYVLVQQRKIIAIEVKTGRRKMNSGLQKFKAAFKPRKSIVVGSDGVSLEEFLLMDLEELFH